MNCPRGDNLVAPRGPEARFRRRWGSCNRVILDPVERQRLMKIGAEVDHAVGGAELGQALTQQVGLQGPLGLAVVLASDGCPAAPTLAATVPGTEQGFQNQRTSGARRATMSM